MHQAFLVRFLRCRSFFNRFSSFRYTSWTDRNFRTALPIRSASVLPGTGGAGLGFIPAPS
jgi:hypothetical protein